MVKERVKELGGQHFTAYGGNGNAVDVQIAAPNARFVNKNGKSVPVNKDLATKNRGSRIKQEAVVLADELVSAARYKKSRPANYPHGWLDDNGRNEWAEWKTYIQNKENSVWEATLHIATSATGEKFLYDIDPIKMAEQSGNSDTSTAQSTPPARGGDDRGEFGVYARELFQSTPPARGATTTQRRQEGRGEISIHAPARGATIKIRKLAVCHYISIHAPREGATRKKGRLLCHVAISIHAPREGGDCCRRCRSRRPSNFNPRPREGGDRFFGVCHRH